MTEFYRLFFKGFFTLLPLFLTLYFIFWFVSSIEGLLNRYVVSVIPDALHFPGIGIVTAVVVFVGVGFLMKLFAGGKVFHFFEEQLRKVPVIGTVYGPLKDMTGLFASRPEKEMKRVVLVQIPAFNSKMLGFVTRDHFDDLPQMNISDDSIAIYIPGTYFFGGITMIFPRAQVEEVNLPPEQALKLAITGWIKGDLKNDLASVSREAQVSDQVNRSPE